MKKFFLLAVIALSQNVLLAQPWMPAHFNGQIKYTDALNRYNQYHALYGNEQENEPQEGSEVREDGNHLFEKWNYYWKMHLDKDGYMVSPAQTAYNWQQYMDTHGSSATGRTTTIPSNWIFQGPASCNHGYSGLGRINVVSFDPLDSNTFYIGSAGSNAWKTTDGGATWTSMYDYLPMQGVADIKINPLNRNEIFIATGDGDNGDSYSSGLIVSHNGGLTWSPTGLSWSPSSYYSIHSMVINPLDTNCMILASTNGLYKTSNGGATWHIADSANFKQIIYNPADTTILYGSKYTDTFAQIMRSTNGGNTWSAVTSFTGSQRISLAVCPASPTVVKAIVSNSGSGLMGIYGSTNRGATYTPLFTDDTTCVNDLLGYSLGLPTSSCGGQGWYDLCIAIDPTNANNVTVGGVNTYYSNDGGSSWTIANQWYGGLSGVATVHADKHCLKYNPLNNALFETCDGGVYKNTGTPTTGTWNDLTDGITITEFYRNAVDNNVTFCIGGAQDNGTKMVTTSGPTDLTGGDGMQPLINYGDPSNMWYCSYQYGSIDMTRNGGASYTNITDTIHSSGGWISPYVIHPTDTETLYLAYKQVYVTHNNGLSWTPASPVFDTNSDIDRLAIATTNPNYLYLSYYNYNVWLPYIQYTTNAGISWDTISIPFNDYISDLIIDPKNEKHIMVTCPWYGRSKVWSYDLTTNVWTDETGSLPDIAVDCILIDSNSKTQYVGTDVAVFYKDTTMSDWALYNTNLPAVHVEDLHINYNTNQLWAATYGRGMWATAKADHTVSVATIKPTENIISVYPNPATNKITIKSTEPINSVVISNLLGQTMISESVVGMIAQIDVSGLANGMYFVKVNGLYTKKILKE